jgi:protein-S-isoprenylcysteine O-methyltransferase Ste14
MNDNRETLRIRAQPPIIFFGAIIIGILLNHWIPAKWSPKLVQLFAGIPLTLFSMFLASITFREFITHGVSVDHKKPTRMIIATGPFRFTRNPLYVSGILLVVGVGVLLNNLWIIGLLVPSVFLVMYGAILQEERYLTNKFGEEYLKYKSSVRRWL